MMEASSALGSLGWKTEGGKITPYSRTYPASCARYDALYFKDDDGDEKDVFNCLIDS